MKDKWTQTEIEQEVLRIVREEKQFDATFTATTSFEEARLDSLSLVRILVAIDQCMGVWLEGDSLTPDNLRDVQSVAKHLSGILQAGGSMS